MHADFSVELGRDDAALELPWSSDDGAVRFYDLKNQPELLQQIPEAVAYRELGAFLARINAAGFPLATAKCDAWQSREVAPEEEIYGDRKFVSYVDLVFEDEAARCSLEKHEAFAKNLCRLLSQTPEIPAAVEVVIRRCYYHGEGALREVAAGEGGAEGRGDVEEVTAAETATDAGGAGETAETRNTAGAKDNDEQQSVAANREGADRVESERIEQQADVGHGMKYEGSADAGEQAEADIEKAKSAEPLNQTAADERVGRSGLDGSVSGFCFTAYVTGFGDSDHEPHLRWQIALALLQNALVQLGQRLMRGGSDDSL
jgi:hypothetical protein